MLTQIVSPNKQTKKQATGRPYVLPAAGQHTQSILTHIAELVQRAAPSGEQGTSPGAAGRGQSLRGL